MMYSLTATEPTSFCRFTIAWPESTLRTSGFLVARGRGEDLLFLVGAWDSRP